MALFPAIPPGASPTLYVWLVISLLYMLSGVYVWVAYPTLPKSVAGAIFVFGFGVFVGVNRWWYFTTVPDSILIEILGMVLVGIVWLFSMMAVAAEAKLHEELPEDFLE